MDHAVLRTSYPYMISPTFSSLLTHSHTCLLMSSSPRQTGTRTCPLSSPMPPPLRWNSIPLLDVSTCFTSISIRFAPPSALQSVGFHFISRMFSPFVSAATPPVAVQHRPLVPFPLSTSYDSLPPFLTGSALW